MQGNVHVAYSAIKYPYPVPGPTNEILPEAGHNRFMRMCTWCGVGDLFDV